jgi:hypothetical protein
MIRVKGADFEKAISSKNRDRSVFRDVGSGHHRIGGFNPAGGAAIGNLRKNDGWCRSRGGSFDYLSKGENAMQYMLMCCFDETLWAKMPEVQKGQIMQEYGAFIQSIVKSGHFRASTKLHPTSMATTVREQHGKLITTDGPFAETKEQLGGYHLVECQDLDEAIEIARRIPTLRVGGTIEVRPVVPASQW